MADLIIVPTIRRAMQEDEIQKIEEFAFGVIDFLNQLLKNAFELRELNDFGTFIETVKTIYETLAHSVNQDKVSRIELQLDFESNIYTKGDLRKKLAITKSQLNTVNELKFRKSITLYGINSWILHTYENGGITPEDFKKWHGKIPHFGNLKETWEVFLRAQERGTKRGFNWDWWELDERVIPGRLMTGGHYLGFSGTLDRLIVVRCLQLLKEINPAKRSTLDLPVSRDLEILAGREGSPLKKVLDEIENGSGKLGSILDNRDLEAVPSFRALLSQAVERKKEEDNKKILAAPISEERIGIFKINILKGWQENTVARDIIKEFGRYEPGAVPPDDTPFWGYITRDSKEIFTDTSDLMIHDYGVSYGIGLAKTENDQIFRKILGSLPEFRPYSVPEDKILPSINEAIFLLTKADYNPVILVYHSWLASQKIQNSVEFRPPKKTKDTSLLLGYYKGTPVLRLYGIRTTTILVVDLRKFGVWHQFKTKPIFPEEQVLANELSFLLRPIPREVAEELIREHPQLLKAEGTGSERPKEKVITEIQKTVHLRIVEQFDFVVEDPNAGYKMGLAEDT